MKYCKDCRHFDGSDGCLHPAMMITDVVLGPSPSKARGNREHGACTMDARLFEGRFWQHQSHAIDITLVTSNEELLKLAQNPDCWNAPVTGPRKRGRPKKHV